MKRLDIYDRRPAGMDAYLATYGWHFSKAMCEFAVSLMRDKDGAKIKMPDKKALLEQMKQVGVEFESKGYDAVYVYCMGRTDFLGNAIGSETMLYKFVDNYLNDKDGYEGIALTRFFADCMAKGEPIMWEEML